MSILAERGRPISLPKGFNDTRDPQDVGPNYAQSRALSPDGRHFFTYQCLRTDKGNGRQNSYLSLYGTASRESLFSVTSEEETGFAPIIQIIVLAAINESGDTASVYYDTNGNRSVYPRTPDAGYCNVKKNFVPALPHVEELPEHLNVSLTLDNIWQKIQELDFSLPTFVPLTELPSVKSEILRLITERDWQIIEDYLTALRAISSVDESNQDHLSDPANDSKKNEAASANMLKYAKLAVDLMSIDPEQAGKIVVLDDQTRANLLSAYDHSQTWYKEAREDTFWHLPTLFGPALEINILSQAKIINTLFPGLDIAPEVDPERLWRRAEDGFLADYIINEGHVTPNRALALTQLFPERFNSDGYESDRTKVNLESEKNQSIDQIKKIIEAQGINPTAFAIINQALLPILMNSLNRYRTNAETRIADIRDCRYDCQRDGILSLLDIIKSLYPDSPEAHLRLPQVELDQMRLYLRTYFQYRLTLLRSSKDTTPDEAQDLINQIVHTIKMYNVLSTIEPEEAA